MEQLLPNATALPVSQATPAGDAGAAAHFQGQVFPGQAGLEYEHDAGQTSAILNGRTAALARPSFVSRQKRLDYLPKFVGNQWTRHGCSSIQSKGYWSL